MRLLWGARWTQYKSWRISGNGAPLAPSGETTAVFWITRVLYTLTHLVEEDGTLSKMFKGSMDLLWHLQYRDAPKGGPHVV